MRQKKIFFVLFLICMVFASVYTAYAAGDTALSVDEVRYFSGNESVYTIGEKDIYSCVYINNTSDAEKSFRIINAAFSGDKLSDIDISRKAVPSGAEREKIVTDTVSVSKDDKVCKTFLWENEGGKIKKVAQLSDKSCEKKIKSFTVSVSGNDFKGYVNSETNKIMVYIPTQYMYAAYSDVVDSVASVYPCAIPADFNAAVEGGVTPQIEGVGKIEKNGTGNFTAPVTYTVTADDGSAVDYDVEIIDTKMRMHQTISNSNVGFKTGGLPDTNSRLGGGVWGWITADSAESYTTSFTENPKSFRAVKNSKTGTGGYYTCSTFLYSLFGFAKRAIIDVDIRIAELGDGAGLCFSFFSTEQDTEKNSNLIFKKVPDKREAELYWSRVGMQNGEKIEGAKNITLDEFHNIRVVRTMEQEKNESGTYKGTLELYIDYELVSIFVDTNYITFNGETNSSPSVRHNAAYNHISYCSADVGEENGTTFTLDIKKIDVQAEMYSERVRSQELYDTLGKFDEKFNMDFLYWLASLYDKESGGFYHSASARDYPGYAADIESTANAIDILQRLGVWDSEAKNEGMIPQEFIDGLANFAIERQNPDDGYFYDPQWGYEINDFKRDRSLYQALGIIAVKDGAVPKYKTPSERTEETDAELSQISLFSTDERFTSEENCRAWLNTLWNTNEQKYTAISNVAASWSLVEAAGYQEVVRDFLREKQNPDTGLFGEGLTSDALNAAMKACCAFDSPKAPYPNYQKALRSITEIIADSKPANAPEVWNPLAAINTIISSNSLNVTIEELAELDGVLEEFYKVIYGYFAEYFQEDFGASTYREGSSITGGDATAVDLAPGGREGDMGGSNMLVRTKNDAYAVAGVSEKKLFTKEQKREFWNLIRNAQPVTKKTEDELWYSISDNFEDYGETELLDKWRIIRRKDTDVYVDKKKIFGNSENKCMRFHCGVEGGNTYLSRHCFTPENYTSVCEKFYIYIDSNGAYFQAGMGTGHKEMYTAFLYLIDARGKKVADIYTQTGTGGQKIMTLNLDQWYEFMIKYYPDRTENVIEFYVDGTLMYSGNDYYNMGIEGGAPTKVVDGVSFMKYHASTGSLYIDNLEYYYE